ncbi:malate dehydrogenase (quinone) [Oleiharenicola lentus]|uniref:Probable malate:quinone oxidoreductase n=1 Tax=Oleiharenicola lentus TaxID=2508720 RepID=A0A4Q1C6R2_9BACT|nr:malate dehydrogenase (quinone) [Oleiharenicola lentus]RXK54577.1 malate dehydrogenase (quinone) [Oleiharenicola lentus]
MNSPSSNPDVVLIGSGVMSANLGALLKRLDPSLSIQCFEAADELAYESSNGWNNAGTGHAGICEISYTPKPDDGSPVKVQKVIDIFQEFEQTLQFWAHAVGTGMIEAPKDFINPVQHISFVHGGDQVAFLKSRYAGMSAHHFFREMEFTTDPKKIGSWAPLLTEGRDPAVPIAATKMDGGTDINFGVLSRKLLTWLAAQPGCSVTASSKVVDLKKQPDGRWAVTVHNRKTGAEHTVTTKFVFVGAGGGSLPLLQLAGLPEAKGLGGFPIGGHWLVCDKPEIVARHQAKVYGQNLPEAPTMAVPHLDTRILDGKKTLLFGPFAAWTTRFLHRTGSWTDLPRSIRPHNVMTLLKIAATNFPLVRYLMQQGTQSMADRMRVMHIFYPNAKPEDWKLVDGGIRVQAIKKTDGEAGIVHFGTEVLTSADKSMSALLGASPGASVCVNIVTEVIRKSFPHLTEGEAGIKRLQEFIPTYGVDYREPQHAAKFNDLAIAARKQLKLI